MIAGDGMPKARKEPAADAPVILHLTRHGQTVWHAENRYAGSSDVDLTRTGQQQAARLGRWAAQAQLSALYCSPVRRARETAEPVAAATGLPILLRGDLREVHFGVAEGLTIAELRSQSPEIAARFESDPVNGHFPEAENPSEAAQRGTRVLRDIAATHPGATVLVVGHNTLTRLTLCALLGIPLAHYRQILPRFDNGALTTISLTVDPSRPAALLALNVPVLAAMSPLRAPQPVSPR